MGEKAIIYFHYFKKKGCSKLKPRHLICRYVIEYVEFEFSMENLTSA